MVRKMSIRQQAEAQAGFFCVCVCAHVCVKACIALSRGLFTQVSVRPREPGGEPLQDPR